MPDSNDDGNESRNEQDGNEPDLDDEEHAEAERSVSRKHLVTARPTKPWDEMSEDEKRRFVESVYAEMKRAFARNLEK